MLREAYVEMGRKPRSSVAVVVFQSDSFSSTRSRTCELILHCATKTAAHSFTSLSSRASMTPCRRV
jgi:hypothetical protein